MWNSCNSLWKQQNKKEKLTIWLHEKVKSLRRRKILKKKNTSAERQFKLDHVSQIISTKSYTWKQKWKTFPPPLIDILSLPLKNNTLLYSPFLKN